MQATRGVIDGLSSDLVRAVRPAVPALVERITERIRGEVAAYAGPPEGRRSRLIALAVDRAVHHFLDVLEHDPRSGPDVYRLFRQMGHGEARDGHDLDAIRAAHQIATRDSWDELHRLAADHHLPADVITALTEALFTYIQQLTEQAKIGYADGLRARLCDTRAARRDLAVALVDGPPGEHVASLAERAGWHLPSEVVVLAAEVPGGATRLGLAGLPSDALVHGGDRLVVVVCPTTSADAAQDHLLEQSAVRRAAVSWPIPVDETRPAVHWTRRALRLASRGIIGGDRLVDCAEHRVLLWLHADPTLARHASLDLLEPLAQEQPHHRAMLAETLLMHLRTRASAPTMAAALGVHEQTVRNRLRRLKQLFGSQLDDPHEAVALLIALETSTTSNT